MELLLQIGEYQKGQDKEADQAIERMGAIRGWLGQGTHELSHFNETLNLLETLTQ
ncbi:hypothetical protein S96127_4483 (plasmid) [Yersinia pestis]|nr:hypothetical protein S96127_4483 [Yersinia pestis]